MKDARPGNLSLHFGIGQHMAVTSSDISSDHPFLARRACSFYLFDQTNKFGLDYFINGYKVNKLIQGVEGE